MFHCCSALAGPNIFDVGQPAIERARGKWFTLEKVLSHWQTPSQWKWSLVSLKCTTHLWILCFQSFNRFFVRFCSFQISSYVTLFWQLLLELHVLCLSTWRRKSPSGFSIFPMSIVGSGSDPTKKPGESEEKSGIQWGKKQVKKQRSFKSSPNTILDGPNYFLWQYIVPLVPF